jgi:hypothetical protein
MVVANIVNTQSQTADMGWSSSLGVGRGANNSSPLEKSLLRNVTEDLRIADWALVNTVMNLRFPYKKENFLTS